MSRSHMWLGGIAALAIVLAGHSSGSGLGLTASSSAPAAGCTKVGSPGDDVLRGTPHRDVICGRGGDDAIYGKGGKDRLEGGSGKDLLVGGDGADRLVGKGGKDRLEGGSGKDLLVGGDGADRLVGGPGNDGEVATAGPANRAATTSATDSTGLLGGDGPDSISGGTGSDALLGQPGDDLLNGGAGDDFLDGGPGDNVCHGGSGTDTLAVNCDDTPPQLTDFSFAPTSIDTSASDQEITVTAHITDDLSGNSGARGVYSFVSFTGPSGQGYSEAIFTDAQRVSGTPTDGIYESQMTVPQWSAQGTWKVSNLRLIDEAGNHQSLSASDLAGQGFPTTFQQTGAGDDTPPQLTDFSFTPTSIDTSASDQEITVTAHITDDLSGNSGARGVYSFVSFTGPSGQGYSEAIFTDAQRVSGTPTDGIYESQMTVPQWSAQGTWKVSNLRLIDEAGNHQSLSASDLAGQGFPTTFQQTGAGDDTPPQLTDFSFTPTSIDTSASDQEITVTAHITDDLSGNSGARGVYSFVRFSSPSEQQYGNATFIDGTRISGTALDGVYQDSFTLPQFSQCGTWKVSLLRLIDEAGNHQSLSASDLAGQGFPTTFHNC